jgi:hypothetical protein
MPIFFLARSSKIFPNWDFWFENKPSGNPGTNVRFEKLHTVRTLAAVHTGVVQNKSNDHQADWFCLL